MSDALKTHISIASIISLFFVSCTAPAPKAIHPKGQIITVSDSVLSTGSRDTVRFGHLGSGEIAVKPLLLHNTSQRPMVVGSYDRSCGCTTLEYDPQPIMPDSIAAVHLTFDSRGLFGWQFKQIKIQLAGANAPLTIYIDAEVE